MKFAALADVTLTDVEQFFYLEASLLDAPRFTDWLQLVTEDVRCEVPATDWPAGGLKDSFTLVGDDMARLRSRVKHLLEGWNLGETPPSRTRRLITNVRILETTSTELHVAANFAVYRFRRDIMDTFIGRYENSLVVQDGELKIRRRRAVLDHEALRPHGMLTIIL
jgi:p-cumate 2,3-dioxygenase beta subunit